MTFLPIVERGLRIGARQRSTYRTRLIVVGLLLAVWFFLSVVAPHSGTPVRRAHAIFNAITIVGLGFSMLAGIFLTADCLSEERREGTLGLLFLTDLKGYDVVLGKLVSTSLHALYALLAGMPLLALPLLTGGMTAGEFWRMMLVLTATLYLSLSAGMCISAVNREARAAIGGTLLTMLVLSGIMPVLWWLLRLVRGPIGFDWLLWPSPAYAYRYAFDVNYSGYYGAREFWTSIAVIVGLGTACLIATMVLLPFVWQEKGQWGRADDARSRSYRARFGSNKLRAARRGLLNANPFYWLTMRDQLAGRWVLRLFFVLIPIWLCFFIATFSSRSTAKNVGFTVVMFMAYGLHLFLKCWIAIEASRRLSEDRQSGALELLLVTPLQPKDIVAGQRRALWNSFALPVFVLAMVNTAMIWLMMGPNPIGMNTRELPMFVGIYSGGIVLLVMDVHALVRMAMWTSLTARRHNRAILAALGRVMGPSWAAVLFFFVFLLGMAGGGLNQGDVGILMVLWFIFGAGVDVVNIVGAEVRLSLRFRRAAAPGYAADAAQAAKISSGAMKLSPVWTLQRFNDKRL